MYKPKHSAVRLDFQTYLIRHVQWGWHTFGTPADGRGPLGPLDHLKKEISEIAEHPEDIVEWIDAIILAIDGYCRAGGTNLEFDVIQVQAVMEKGTPLFGLRHTCGLLDADPMNLGHWQNAVFYAVMGYAQLNGNSTEELLMQMFAKQRKNFNRIWPDWRKSDPNKAVEHVRGTHD